MAVASIFDQRAVRLNVRLMVKLFSMLTVGKHFYVVCAGMTNQFDEFEMSKCVVSNVCRN